MATITLQIDNVRLQRSICRVIQTRVHLNFLRLRRIEFSAYQSNFPIDIERMESINLSPQTHFYSSFPFIDKSKPRFSHSLELILYTTCEPTSRIHIFWSVYLRVCVFLYIMKFPIKTAMFRYHLVWKTILFQLCLFIHQRMIYLQKKGR